MDWDTLYCPNPACWYYDYPFPRSRLVKNGTSYGHKQALCRECATSVCLRYGTAYEHLNADPAIFETAVRALAEGNSLRSTARSVEIDKDTACDWLHRAACHARLVMLSLWQDLAVSECQLDELWSFVHPKEANLETAWRVGDTYADAWIWVAFAPLWRLVLAFVVGKRTQQSANLLLERVVAVTRSALSTRAITTVRQSVVGAGGRCHKKRHPVVYQRPVARISKRLAACLRTVVSTGSKGRARPLSRSKTATASGSVVRQVVQQRERGPVVAVSTKVVFGAEARLQACLHASSTSQAINTSFVERENLTLRQHNRRLSRKTNGFSKELCWLEKQLWLSLAYYHLVLPHQSLRRELPRPQPTRGTGSQQRWQLVTPAMAAGMTKHVWTTQELLSYRVSADFLETLMEKQNLFPDFEAIHQGK
jgi:IS1 family transposase